MLWSVLSQLAGRVYCEVKQTNKLKNFCCHESALYWFRPQLYQGKCFVLWCQQLSEFQVEVFHITSNMILLTGVAKGMKAWTWNLLHAVQMFSHWAILIPFIEPCSVSLLSTDIVAKIFASLHLAAVHLKSYQTEAVQPYSSYDVGVYFPSALWLLLYLCRGWKQFSSKVIDGCIR